jgi:hypothetical protein
MYSTLYHALLMFRLLQQSKVLARHNTMATSAQHTQTQNKSHGSRLLEVKSSAHTASIHTMRVQLTGHVHFVGAVSALYGKLALEPNLDLHI